MDNKKFSITPKYGAKKSEMLNIETNQFVSYKKTSITKEYTLGRPIHESQISQIRMVTNKETGAKKVVKIIKKSNLDEDKYLKAINLLCMLSHPNILQTYEFFDDNKNYYIVYEVCNGGQLLEHICEKGSFTEKDAALIMRQVLSALAYAHKNKIVHK